MRDQGEELVTFANTNAYSGLTVDIQDARQFYGETVGLKTSEQHGLMWLHLTDDRDKLVFSRTRPSTN